jgi:GDP-L-fucose synthase
MKKTDNILILGASGLLGSGILKLLKDSKYETILTPNSKKLNLLNKEEVEKYLKKEKPKFIFMIAGFVGGILGNKNSQADFLYKNTTMILNLLEGIKNSKIKTKILYTGSTCIYPNDIKRPIKESDFLSSYLEDTNIGYAIAKISGIIACQKYKEQYKINSICVMPTNLYGIGDNYNLQTGHFLSSLIKKFIIAKKENKKEIEFWGTGKAQREALYNLDCADAIIYLMENYNSSEIVNIGTGFDYSIKEYIKKMKNITNYKGKIIWDKTKPNGTLRKQTDIKKLKTIYPKFNPRSFEEGVEEIMKNEKEMKRIFKKE